MLSEGAASLLPGELRAAALWTIDLDADGEPVRVDLRRARVRSRAQLDYPSVQAQADAGTLPEPLALLPAIGALLQRRAAERGAIELGTPDQEVEATPDGGWTLVLRGDLPVEGWNAEISLLTGRCAAALMLDGGVGVLRTLPAAPAAGRRPAAAARAGARRRLARRRRVRARSSPASTRPAPGTRPSSRRPSTLLRGAAYTAFDGAPPEQPGHGGVGAPYAHVTAPLRRLVDRFGTEVCLALAAGARARRRSCAPRCRSCPALMAASDRRTREVERAVVDATEAWLLRGREGAAVPRRRRRRRGRRAAPWSWTTSPIRGRCTGEGLRPGTRVRVRLEQADVAGRTVRFALGGRHDPAPRTSPTACRASGRRSSRR